MITLPRTVPAPEPGIEHARLGRDGTVAWIAPHGRWITRHISRLTPADLAQLPAPDRGGIELIRAVFARRPGAPS